MLLAAVADADGGGNVFPKRIELRMGPAEANCDEFMLSTLIALERGGRGPISVDADDDNEQAEIGGLSVVVAQATLFRAGRRTDRALVSGGVELTIVAPLTSLLYTLSLNGLLKYSEKLSVW